MILFDRFGKKAGSVLDVLLMFMPTSIFFARTSMSSPTKFGAGQLLEL